MTLKVIICDDCGRTRDVLKRYLEILKIREIEIIGEVQDGVELINICKETFTDIILLDIDMPDISGIDAAKKIVEFAPDTAFIFITGHTSYAVESFEVYPVDYILKPVSIERLENSLKRIINLKISNLNKSNKTISFNFNHENYTIEQNSILFIEKVGRKTVIHTLSRKIEVNEPLSSIIERLNPEVFVRSHQSYIINKEAIFKRCKTLGRIRKVLFDGYDKPAYISRDKIKNFVEWIK